MAWTLELVGVATKTLAEWGLRAGPLTINNQIPDSFVLDAPGLAADAEPLFAYGASVKIRRDVVVRAGAVVSGSGTLFFQGKVYQRHANLGAREESQVYVVHGPWRDLIETPFGQVWKSWNGSAEVDVTVTRIFVPTKIENNAIEFLTTGEMIEEVVSFAAGKGVNIQAGATIADNVTMQMPIFELIGQKCSEVIQRMLALMPDARVEFDYTTDPPTMNVWRRAQMTARSINLKDENLSALRLTPRDDLRATAVGVHYRSTDVNNGVIRQNFFQDVYPVGADPFAPGALCEDVDLIGSARSTTSVEIETALIEPYSKNWWSAHVGLLWLTAGGWAVVIKEDSVLPALFLPRFVTNATALPAWLDGSVVQQTITAIAQVTRTGDDGIKEIFEVPLSATITTTDLASGTYSRLNSFSSAEPRPDGLAQAVYDALNTTQYEGSATITEIEIGASQSPLTLHHLLSFPGGTGRWANINATPQSITFNPHTGESTVNFGPPGQLRISQKIEIFRFFHTRLVYNDPLSAQLNTTFASNDVEFPATNPKTNSNTFTPQYREMAVRDNVAVGTSTAATNVSTDGVSTAAWSALNSQITAIKANQPVQFRETTVTVKDGDGNCVEKKCILLRSEFYDP